MEKFYKLVKKLRKECPWDAEQNLKTLIPFMIEETYELIDAINKNDRDKIVEVIKNIKLTVSNVFGVESAIVTSGGISLKEINSKTMKSKVIDNLFFSGEVIDLDGTTGGYNLQMCWSTGYVAGQNAV